MTRLNNNQQKERTCRIVNFCRLKRPQNKIKRKQNDLDRKLKNQCNMKKTVMPIVNGTLGTISRELVKGMEDLEIR